METPLSEISLKWMIFEKYQGTLIPMFFLLIKCWSMWMLKIVFT